MAEILERRKAALADRYLIEPELGAGGMATVYLAEDVEHHRQAAVKVLRLELSALLGADRFVKEIELTANLQHPHLLPLFDSGEANGLLYYVMPYVEGESLRVRLYRDRQLGIDEAVRITTQVGQRPRLCPPTRHPPPGHQAREHSAARGPGADRRLRDRARPPAGRWKPRNST